MNGSCYASCCGIVVSTSECKSEGHGFKSHQRQLGFFLDLTGPFPNLGVLWAKLEGWNHRTTEPSFTDFKRYVSFKSSPILTGLFFCCCFFVFCFFLGGGNEDCFSREFLLQSFLQWAIQLARAEMSILTYIWVHTQECVYLQLTYSKATQME